MKRSVFTLYLFLSPLTAFMLCGCALNGAPARYSDCSLWYDNGKDTDPDKADVFYVIPSCIYDWTDAQGTVQHNACVQDSVQRVRMSWSFTAADDIFADSANFFSPYYRQITLNAWSMDAQLRDSCLELALDDVRNAFSYYLDHLNQGRPFILAGFSQGARCALQLLREMSPDVADRMIAAYLIGYPITQQDLDSCSLIRPAHGASDTGVCIAFSTVTDTAAASDLINGGNAVVINPASWTTDSRRHRLNDSVSVSIDRTHKLLVAHGIDPMQAYKPKLSGIIPIGNLHLLELQLYGESLKSNVKERIKAY